LTCIIFKEYFHLTVGGDDDEISESVDSSNDGADEISEEEDEGDEEGSEEADVAQEEIEDRDGAGKFLSFLEVLNFYCDFDSQRSDILHSFQGCEMC
jgi:TATA-binding protein-associated factor Taf7